LKPTVDNLETATSLNTVNLQNLDEIPSNPTTPANIDSIFSVPQVDNESPLASPSRADNDMFLNAKSSSSLSSSMASTEISSLYSLATMSDLVDISNTPSSSVSQNYNS